MNRIANSLKRLRILNDQLNALIEKGLESSESGIRLQEKIREVKRNMPFG